MFTLGPVDTLAKLAAPENLSQFVGVSSALYPAAEHILHRNAGELSNLF